MTDQPGTVYDREELAWAAGFFDGEGWTGTIPRPAGRSPRFQLAVVQYEPTTLARFHRALGVGRVHQTMRRGKPSWMWHAQSFEHAQASVALLWTWLSEPKRAQAASALRRYHAERAEQGVRPWSRGGAS